MNEVWKTVSGYEGIYQVSNLGAVRSLDRVVFNQGNGAECKVKGKILRPNKDRGGYLYVGLYDKDGLKTTSVKIHRLVAIAFCSGFSDVNNEVNHLDCNRQNNKSTNLEWTTRTGNIRHKFKMGYKIPTGSANPAAKLKEDHLPIIIQLFDLGVDQETISKSFNVSQTTISNVIRGKHYNLIPAGLAIEKTN